MQQTC